MAIGSSGFTSRVTITQGDGAGGVQSLINLYGPRAVARDLAAVLANTPSGRWRRQPKAPQPTTAQWAERLGSLVRLAILCPRSPRR